MAMVHSRVRRVVYGSADPVRGFLGSCASLHEVPELNHHYEVLWVVCLCVGGRMGTLVQRVQPTPAPPLGVTLRLDLHRPLLLSSQVFREAPRDGLR
jgi:hypothetical protein